MSTVEIIILVVVVLIVLLAAGGYVANGRRLEAEAATLRERAREADAALAEAHAADKGWDPKALEAAARTIYTERHGAPPGELLLVQVVDRPGTEEDEAIFIADADETIALARRGDTWVPGNGPAA